MHGLIKWQFIGAILHDVPVNDEAENLDFAGSLMVVVAESAEEAKSMVKDDIYVKSDVWDLEKVRLNSVVFIEAIETDTTNQPGPSLSHKGWIQIPLVTKGRQALYR